MWRMGRAANGLAALATAGVLSAALAADAHAAFPVATNGDIAYQRYTATGFEIFSMSSTGAGQINLTNDDLYEVNPSYSPDGRRLAIAREGAGGITDIWVMNADGTAPVNLTNTSTLSEFSPVFSPDGKWIAYNTSEEDPPTDVWLMRADGTGQRNLTNTATIPEAKPDFSPDGGRIVFQRCQGKCEIYVMTPDGSGLTNVTNSPATNDRSPRYSPDGSRIAFERDFGSIAVMNTDGTGVAAIPTLGTGPESPAFSADGRQIVYAGVPPGDSTKDIFTQNVDGTGGTDLTNTMALREEGPQWQAIFNCGGRRATIVGTDSGEKLKGTKGPDVIVGNGGKDRIKGLGGRDRLCGGRGRDRIAGGKGAKDLCRGQQGKDYGGKGCEKGKL